MKLTSAPLNVANVFFFALIMTVAILVIDLAFLALVDLLKNADALLVLLFCESLVMLLVGAAGWGEEHAFVDLGSDDLKSIA